MTLHKPALWLALLIAPLLVVVACADSDSDQAPATADQAAADEGTSDEGVTVLVHVHGLGLNPADGRLYIATHFGLYRAVPGGDAELVDGTILDANGEAGPALRYHDFMGFTVAGPDHFVASGHPDFRERDRLPPLLGFIDSTDGGRTWRPLALFGAVDFHALHVLAGRLYGWSSTDGAFMASVDGGATWETRVAAPLFDFAVSPDNPDTIVAADDAGVALSRDGGRSWTRAAAPLFSALSWHESGTLWGTAIDGSLFSSDDAGATWQERGAIDKTPEAFLALDGLLYVAVDGGEILSSTDAGRTWETFTTVRPTLDLD